MSSALPYPFLIVGLGISGVVFTVLSLMFRSDRRVDARIRSIEVNRRSQSLTGDSSKPLPGILSAFMQLLTPRKTESVSELKQRLISAGFNSPSAVSIFSTSQVISATLLGALFYWLTRYLPPKTIDGLLATLIGGCLGFLAPNFWLKRRTGRRQRRLERALPDFLDLMIACMDAGLSFESAMIRISDDLFMAHPELGEEIRRVQRDVELGATSDRALHSLYERTGVDAFRTLASACGQARRFGSRLSATLRTLGDTLRHSREQKAEEAAQAAAVKILLPTLILLFPIIFVVLAGPAAIQIVEQFSAAGMNSD